ncbi:ABC1 kinase family protein [Desulfovibrio ferrophilus]|uniref:ABC-1 domain-containing protein n=1 Tax=Desulfovibrio ferrophilus TaxID=241368 RepID=A0A2Z6B195_9BACT|nr:AarF/UbiB family protein [Desulfovibrio ferrophilus]BBD09282.1 ABC-1 domain-containing protein [Desulfovibrio ferrophilus]
MKDQIPKGKLRRSVIGGKTAVRVGGQVLGYMAKKPFLSKHAKQAARQRLDESSAQAVFACLSLLKGTALKVAQMLSMELELFPEAVCRELQKSYNQVPPMNRALASKAATNALGKAPGQVFEAFETEAFAAASLGQVHAAQGSNDRALAVKLQYPGINRTIEDDMQLIKRLLRPLPDFVLIGPVLNEIEARLMEEIDYEAEARNMTFFQERLDLTGVLVPEPWLPGCSGTILSATKLDGLPLNQWLETNPDVHEREVVAERLNDIFIKSFYELRCIHADPNPGNYIVGPDLSVGLVDFGCVKTFSVEFVENYRQLIRIVSTGQRDKYFSLLRRMKFIQEELDEDTEEAIFQCAYGFGGWLGRLYESERFDFGAVPGYIAEGREWSRTLLKYRRSFTPNPDFVFLDRTRYGLLRIFEQFKCSVRLRNPYECGDEQPSAKGLMTGGGQGNEK